MERLTYRTGFPDKVRYVSTKLMYDFLLEMNTQDVEKFRDIVNALGGYEDTGLTPYEINQLQAENVALKARLDKAVELPCKFGDTVYVLMQRNATIEVVKGMFKNVRRYDDGVWWAEFSDLWVDKTLDDFGKTVFLTEADAQVKLDEMKGGADKCNG